ncbi:glycosyltransferase [Stutzerimonas zhaodongensis]|uniref:glycosyltransferase n=1 Tax=Stutzerimonas zhaodongensis TaxID=1176257 RepID=UPI00272B4FEC|nr:glycosyltransferase [Stutzerimonas zhaodongensis]
MSAEQHVLQLCHGYDAPFLDCARQYAVLFRETEYRVTTVYLTGSPDAAVEQGSASDEVIFLEHDSKSIRGLKLGAIRDIRRIAASRKFSFCIAHRSKPAYVALLGTRLPVINVHHAFGDYARRSRQLFANLFRHRLWLLGVSDAVRDDIRRCLPGWPAHRIETLYNRIDVQALQREQLERNASRIALGLPAEAWVVGNVGRLHPDKDQTTLIRGFAHALPSLPEGSLLAILGSGRLESKLRMLAADEGIADRVLFLGQVPQARRYFKAFDVFALSSDHEPFGMVLLEAMAAGVPLICSDCGGGREVMGDAGWLFPLGDASSLARCLTEAAVGLSASREERMASRLIRLFSDSSARSRFFGLIARWFG